MIFCVVIMTIGVCVCAMIRQRLNTIALKIYTVFECLVSAWARNGINFVKGNSVGCIAIPDTEYWQMERRFQISMKY